MRLLLAYLLAIVVAAACAATKPATSAPSPAAPPATARATAPDASRTPDPAVEPPVAYMLGLMPLKSTGVDVFRAARPTYDGRGVLMAILDSGIDPNAPGLIVTSTGGPKILDLRDFSGEGRIALTPVVPEADGRVRINGVLLTGAARIGRLTAATTWYAGVFRELPLGPLPAGDVNGNGENTDAFPVVVVKATDGWVAFLDTNLDGSFEDEMPLHDYRQGRETIALGTRPLTLVANFVEPAGSTGAPTLDLFFDTSAHGTHVAGIAAGHDLFNVAGFDGVAPGAQLIGLKIANNARGGVSVHASMWRAMDYAARFAQQRNLPLVLNLSFGVGNEHEGRAVMDSLVDAFLASHEGVVMAISAGNDGPGLSTMGFPGSADLALSVGATYPGVFTSRCPRVVQLARGRAREARHRHARPRVLRRASLGDGRRDQGRHQHGVPTRRRARRLPRIGVGAGGAAGQCCGSGTSAASVGSAVRGRDHRGPRRRDAQPRSRLPVAQGRASRLRVRGGGGVPP